MKPDEAVNFLNNIVPHTDDIRLYLKELAAIEMGVDALRRIPQLEKEVEEAKGEITKWELRWGKLIGFMNGYDHEFVDEISDEMDRLEES